MTVQRSKSRFFLALPFIMKSVPRNLFIRIYLYIYLFIHFLFILFMYLCSYVVMCSCVHVFMCSCLHVFMYLCIYLFLFILFINIFIKQRSPHPIPIEIPVLIHIFLCLSVYLPFGKKKLQEKKLPFILYNHHITRRKLGI